MRALQFSAYGGPHALRWADAPLPHAGSGQIRIAVRAASVNPIDWKLLSGGMAVGKPLDGTGRLGVDASGVVEQVGPVSSWARRCSGSARAPMPSPRC